MIFCYLICSMSLSVWKESLTELEADGESLTILMLLVLPLPVPVSPVVSMLRWPWFWIILSPWCLVSWIILLQFPSYLLDLVLQTTCFPSKPWSPLLVLLLLVGDSLLSLLRLLRMMNTIARTRIRSRNISDRITPAIIPAVSAELS